MLSSSPPEEDGAIRSVNAVLRPAIKRTKFATKEGTLDL